jgi:cytochrome c peroxidase
MSAVIFISVMLVGLLLCLYIQLNRQQQQNSRSKSIISINRPLQKQLSRIATISGAITIAVLVGDWGAAQVAPISSPLAPLKSVSVPEPDNLSQFVVNKTKAIELGKALFWDIQVGSDNVQSCASCHFHAGVDSRSKNQISPGLLSRLPGGAGGFQIGGAPNFQLTAANYPFHKLSDINDRKSTVISDANDVTSSQGVFSGVFNGQNADGTDKVNYTVDPDGYRISNANVRRVEPRNTPSIVNAVFNFRNFWDGRAQNDFNGRNPFGNRDVNARVVKVVSPNQLQGVQINLNNASLASLSTGPPLSKFEMSSVGRTFPDLGSRFAFNSMKLGRKLTLVTPLGKQLVARDDSVLGQYSLAPQKGMNQNYTTMIRSSFRPEYWNSPLIVKVNASSNPIAFLPPPSRPLNDDEFTLMDYNFPLFFGLAVQLYEATLVADDTPLDRYLAGNASALTSAQQRGKELFEGQGKCINCHGGAEMTNASVRNVRNQPLERMVMGNNGVAVYDNGFYNIAVRPTLEDIGLGGTDPFGKPLSMSRLAQSRGEAAAVSNEPGAPSGPLQPNERVAVDGAFKVPGLRNVALTAPYFHNGGQRTLKEVVDFYNRGGDFHEQNIDNLDADIEKLNFSEAQKLDLVAFLEGLTDDRVLLEKAPFDHPELVLPNGQVGDQNSVTSVPVPGGVNNANDQFVTLPVVGRNGGLRIDSSGLPRSNFLAGSPSGNVPQQAQPLAGSVTPKDCPAGTTLQVMSSGYACLPGK